MEIFKNNQKLVIREACLDDAVNLNEFLKKIILETDQFGLEADELTISDEEQAHTISMFSQADNAILLVATINDKIVGDLSYIVFMLVFIWKLSDHFEYNTINML